MKRLYTIIVAATLTLSCAAQEKYPEFIGKANVPDGTKYLPLPPANGTPQFAADSAQYVWGKSMRQSERGRQALTDVEMNVRSVLASFVEVTGEKRLTENALIVDFFNRVETEACNSTSKAKKAHMRIRPYVYFNEPTLAPEEEASHRKSGSYPSSHSATGWAIALVLAELMPEQQEVILKRGYEFGQSRVIAGYHYQSDVDAARLAASGVVARLHADKKFAKMIAKVKKELRKK